MIKLVVTIAFGGFQPGDEITDPVAIDAMKDSPYVVRVFVPEPRA